MRLLPISFPVYRALSLRHAMLPDPSDDTALAVLDRRGDSRETVPVRVTEAELGALCSAIDRDASAALRDQFRRDAERAIVINPTSDDADIELETTVPRPGILVYVVTDEVDALEEGMASLTGIPRRSYAVARGHILAYDDYDTDNLPNLFAAIQSFFEENLEAPCAVELCTWHGHDALQTVGAFGNVVPPWVSARLRPASPEENVVIELVDTLEDDDVANPHRRHVPFPPGVPLPGSYPARSPSAPSPSSPPAAPPAAAAAAERPEDASGFATRKPSRENPIAGEMPSHLRAAVKTVERFHLRKHRGIDADPFAVPDEMAYAGPCLEVTYRSDKWDDGSHDYVHHIESYPHVNCVELLKGHEPPDLYRMKIPASIRNAVSVGRIGLQAHSYAFEQANGTRRTVRLPRGTRWYWAPAPKALYAVKGAKVLAIIFGGALDVEPRGIVG